MDYRSLVPLVFADYYQSLPTDSDARLVEINQFLSIDFDTPTAEADSTMPQNTPSMNRKTHRGNVLKRHQKTQYPNKR